MNKKLYFKKEEKMEIYIDNKKVNIRKKNFLHLGMAIFEINKKLLKENKILNQIYINGEMLQDNSIVKIENLKTLEIITKSCGGLILESVQNTKQYIDYYFNIVDSFYDFEGENSIAFDDFDMLEIILFLNWFYGLLVLMKENNIFKFTNDKFDDYVEDFCQNLESVENLYKEDKFDELFIELECNTNHLLVNFYNNIDYYIEHIIYEEKSKKLLN